MSTFACDWIDQPCFALQNTTTQTARGAEKQRWSLAATAIIVGLVFLAAGHDFFVSRAVAYTQTADEMQTAALGGNLARRIAFFALAGWGMALWAVGKQPLKIDWCLISGVGAFL